MLRSPILVLLASFLFSSAALAGNCTKSQQDSNNEEAVASQQGAQAGRQAHIDPETGELTSERPEGVSAPQADSADLQQARRDVKIVSHPNGMSSADISGLFMSTLEAEIVDGQLITCHTNPNGGDQE